MRLRTLAEIIVLIILGSFALYSANNPLFEKTSVNGLPDNTELEAETIPEKEVSVPPTKTPVKNPTPATSGSTGETTPPVKKVGFTLAEVKTHADAKSCWSTINGSVYDLTSWINRHPGGSGKILGICGEDGSEAFNDQHEGDARPQTELAGFRIGPLVAQ